MENTARRGRVYSYVVAACKSFDIVLSSFNLQNELARYKIEYTYSYP